MFYNPDAGKTDMPINDSRQRRVTPSSHLSAFQERNGPPINQKLHPTVEYILSDICDLKP